MAYKNKTITHSKTGQQITFLQTAKETNGRLLEMEAQFAPLSKEPPPHYHPGQNEDFTVIEGEIQVKINGVLKNYKASEHFHVPANTVHSMWNNSGSKTIVNWKVQPALNSEYFFETLTGLANDNRTDSDGVPNILQVALLMSKFSGIFRLVKPPFAIQRILFSILSLIGYVFGYRAVYKKYID